MEVPLHKLLYRSVPVPSLSVYAMKIIRVFATGCPCFPFIPEGTKLEQDGWEEVFPEIREEGPERETFLRAVRELQDEGIISVQWKSGMRGEAVAKLRLEDLCSVYSILGEENPWFIYSTCEKCIENWKPCFAYGRAVREHFLECLKEHKPMPVESVRDMEDLIRIIDLRPKKTSRRGIEECAGDFAGGVRRFLRLLRAAERLCFEQAGVVLSRRFGIAGVPPNAVFSLSADLHLAGAAVIEYSREPASLSEKVLDRADSIEFRCRLPVICVQNRKSFHALVKQYTKGINGFVAVEELQGAAEKLIKLISRTDVPLYFFGDIDPAGFTIFQQCSRICGGELRPLHMNVAAYRDNASYGYSLSESDISFLEAMELPEMDEVKREMLSKGVGVKQEYVRLKPLSLKST